MPPVAAPQIRPRWAAGSFWPPGAPDLAARADSRARVQNERVSFLPPRPRARPPCRQGPRSFRRRVSGRPDRPFRAHAGPENRPFAPTGGGPSLRAILLKRRPISGQCVNLGLREPFSGNPESRISGPRREFMGGGPGSFRRRVSGLPDRSVFRRPRKKTGPKYRPATRTGGGPSFITILFTTDVRPQVIRVDRLEGSSRKTGANHYSLGPRFRGPGPAPLDPGQNEPPGLGPEA